MRSSTLAIALLAGAGLVWVLALAGGSGIDADTPVEVLTADPVRVVLPVDATASFIAARIREEIDLLAGTENDPRMVDHLRDVAGSIDLIEYAAQDGFEYFDSGEAAGIAYGLYDAAMGETVVLYSVTIELLPSFYGVGATLVHEDGHWLVNSGVAQRCGARIVHESRGGSILPDHARSTIVTRLQEADEEVHTEYHRLVADATSGSHRGSALQALDTVVGPGCERL